MFPPGNYCLCIYTDPPKVVCTLNNAHWYLSLPTFIFCHVHYKVIKRPLQYFTPATVILSVPALKPPLNEFWTAKFTARVRFGRGPAQIVERDIGVTIIVVLVRTQQ